MPNHNNKPLAQPSNGSVIFKVILVLLILLLGGLIGVGATLANEGRQASAEATDKIADSSEASEESPTEATFNPSAESVDIKLTFTGDCLLGTEPSFDYDTSFNATYEANGADYFLQNVRSVFEDDDLTIVNLEGPLTNATSGTEKEFVFKGPPEFVSILSNSSVEAANVANNHTYDYGEEGFEETLEVLSGAGIKPYGYDQTQIIDVKGIKVGFVGTYTISFEESTALIERAIPQLKEDGAQVIVATLHGGVEKMYEPTSEMTTLAHRAVDLGADLVVGHHPHVLQGIETYNGKHIAYSLGNFTFGGNRYPYDSDTIIFQQTFTVNKDGGVEENDNINIIPCSTSSNSEYNNYQPIIAEGEEAKRILAKVDDISAKI